MQDDIVPDWPQPEGIFERGTLFDPLKFLSTLREVYDGVVTHGGNGGDRAMEYHAFLTMLNTRTKFTDDGHCLFKLFKLDLPISTPQAMFVDHEGSRFLRVDYLRK
jgi:hypothetical protein